MSLLIAHDLLSMDAMGPDSLPWRFFVPTGHLMVDILRILAWKQSKYVLGFVLLFLLYVTMPVNTIVVDIVVTINRILLLFSVSFHVTPLPH